jgi:flavin reductase (DIM6/NTAB) family NADH-FMN oxidoreductase RutF
MNRIPITPTELILPAILQWASDRFLLTAGDYGAEDFNTMTVGWGSLGVMWNKPIAMVLARPSRYTYEFLERHDSFTLSFLPEAQRDALQICGTISGRDTDKIQLAGLTPIASTGVSAPGFDEAELIIECRKIYVDSLAPSKFLQRGLHGRRPRQYRRRWEPRFSPRLRPSTCLPVHR